MKSFPEPWYCMKQQWVYNTENLDVIETDNERNKHLIFANSDPDLRSSEIIKISAYRITG